MTVSVVTDSTSDIPLELRAELKIDVVPLTISFGGEAYRDGVDLTADEFYARLATAKVLPATSQPPPALFRYAYEHLASRGDVVSVHLSHKLSGTVDTARHAAEEVAPGRISVVDTGSVSMGLGLCVLAAARAARAGGSREQCVAAAESTARRLHVAVALETLEFLRRGGRIGRAQAFLGGLLRLKPVITVRDGEVVPLTRARSRAKALDELYALVAHAERVTEIAVLHTTTPDDAAHLAERARAASPDARLVVGRFGPALGVHGGPGMVGIAVVTEDDRSRP
ncbi:MAG: DegV family protein [Chloroflexota bacterium]|nr:DegV family protein [Chloroflexota bacterium]